MLFQNLPDSILQVEVARRGLVHVERAQLLAPMRDCIRPEHSSPGHMTELSGAAVRVPLEALHRLKNSGVKEGGYRKSAFASAMGFSTHELLDSNSRP